MARKEQILTILAGASAPMSTMTLSKELGEPLSNFKTQLDRWLKGELLEMNEAKEYSLTAAGREEALQIGEGGEVGLSEEQLGATEYQHFIKIGLTTGVTPKDLITQTANHIFQGGDYKDLNWVGEGLKEMGIRIDLSRRWFHSWRSYLHQPIPLNVAPEFAIAGAAETGAKEGKKTKGLRDYILGPEDLPVRIGEGLGDMDYEDAMELARIRAASRARMPAAAAAPAESGLEQMEKIIKIAKELQGKTSEAKSYVIKPGEKGYEAEEVTPGMPVIFNPGVGGGERQGMTYFFDKEAGVLKELKPGEPIVVNQKAEQLPGKNYMVSESGEVKELVPGAPIVIIKQAPASQTGVGMTPLQLRDSAGNPVILDIETYIRLEDHKSQQKRDEDKHTVQMEIASSFKDLLGKVGKAAAQMGEGKE